MEDVRVGGLVPGTEYRLRVRAGSTLGFGHASGPTPAFATLPAPPTQPVSSLSLSRASPDTLLLSWKVSGGR